MMKTEITRDCPGDLANPASGGGYQRYNLICAETEAETCVWTSGSPIVAFVDGVARVLGIMQGLIGSSCQTGMTFPRLAFYRDWLLQEGIQETENVVEPRCQSPTFEGSCGINRVPWNPVTFPRSLPIARKKT